MNTSLSSIREHSRMECGMQDLNFAYLNVTICDSGQGI
jgi:hypothetical protein